MPPRNADLNHDPLPAPGVHWVPRRKARVVTAVLDGEITIADACLRYRLSDDEFQSWLTAYERYGAPGLRVTRCQIYRDLRTASKSEPVSAQPS